MSDNFENILPNWQHDDDDYVASDDEAGSGRNHISSVLIDADDNVDGILHVPQELSYEHLIQEDKTNAVEEDPENTDCSAPTTSAIVTSSHEFKSPRRYLLYDRLVANIVDYDETNTAIVEFSLGSRADEDELPIQCGICSNVMHQSQLFGHQRTHLIAKSNRYACVHCTATYRDIKYLAGHIRRHRGIHPYLCEVCDLYYSTKQELRLHDQRLHQQKQHICEICGKTYAQKSQLKLHLEVTHEKKRRYPCLQCDKAYYRPHSLQCHIRYVHNGERRLLKCRFCSMQCGDTHKMARHRKKMHSSPGSFVCNLCQEEFPNIRYFDAHKRSIQCRNNTQRQMLEDQLQNPQEQHNANDEHTGLLVEANEENNNDIEYAEYIDAAVEENKVYFDVDPYIEQIYMHHIFHEE